MARTSICVRRRRDPKVPVVKRGEGVGATCGVWALLFREYGSCFSRRLGASISGELVVLFSEGWRFFWGITDGVVWGLRRVPSGVRPVRLSVERVVTSFFGDALGKRMLRITLCC